MNRLLILLFVFISPYYCVAQNLDLGIQLGTTVYSGDLSPKEFGLFTEDFGGAAGILARMQFESWIGLRASFVYGNVSSDDRRPDELNQNLNFRTELYEGALVAELSPLSFGYVSSNLVVVPYLMGGIGVFQFNPKSDVNGEIIELQPLGTEGQGLPGYDAPYSLTQVAIPFGGGIKFVIRDTWTLGFEVGGRKLLTDYLDDISNRTIRYGDIVEGRGPFVARLSNPSLIPGRDPEFRYIRGGGYNDFYFVSVVSLTYRLKRSKFLYRPGKKGVICPRF